MKKELYKSIVVAVNGSQSSIHAAMYGIVLAKKKIKVQPTEAQVEKGMKYAWGNIGMIIFIIGTVGLFIANYLTMIIPAIKG